MYRVLLLERGGHEAPEARVPGFTTNNIGSAMAELVKAEPEPQNCNGTGCALNVPAVLGGGSTINGMLYVRGSDVDFDKWANITGDARWSYRSVLPYFRKAEDNLDAAIYRNIWYHGRGGPQKVSWEPYRHPAMTPLAAALGKLRIPYRKDINARGQLGHSIAQSTQANGERWSTYRSYLEPVVAQRPNLRIETFAIAQKVLLEETATSPRAVGVQYENAAGQVIKVRASKEVIVSAGALHSPQLLILSGIGPSHHLKTLGVPVVRDLPVGEGLVDHPDVLGIRYACGPPLCEFDWPSREQDLRQYNHSRAGALAAANMLQMMAFLRSSRERPGTGHQPDLQLLFLGTTQTDEITPSCLMMDSWRLNRVVVLVSLMRPESRGWVRLNASNPHGAPLVNLNYFGDDEGHDLSTVVEGLRVALSMEKPLRKAGFTLDRTHNPQCADFPTDTDAFLRCVARTTTATAWHWSGTCRMGRDNDPRSVVDSELRVRGVRGLRVVDASVMPYITSGNTNAPTIMLAEVAADLIRRSES